MKTDRLISKIEKYKELQSKIKEAEKEVDEIKAAIQTHMGEREEVKAGKYTVTWKSHTRAGFDTTALKEENPDTYEKYCKESLIRKFLVS